MAIFDELKSVGKVLQEAGKIEQYKQILEALEKLLDMQKRIVDLEDKNKILNEKIKAKESLSYESNVYWINGDNKDGPFCSRCWDKNKELIRMHPMMNTAYVQCPECKNSVQIKSEPNSNYNREINFDPYE